MNNLLFKSLKIDYNTWLLVCEPKLAAANSSGDLPWIFPTCELLWIPTGLQLIVGKKLPYEYPNHIATILPANDLKYVDAYRRSVFQDGEPTGLDLHKS